MSILVFPVSLSPQQMVYYRNKIFINRNKFHYSITILKTKTKNNSLYHTVQNSCIFKPLQSLLHLYIKYLWNYLRNTSKISWNILYFALDMNFVNKYTFYWAKLEITGKPRCSMKGKGGDLPCPFLKIKKSALRLNLPLKM